MEALKDRANRGDSAPLYFYRDATSNEIDLLMPVGRQFHGIEAKAGATVNLDYFRGLAAFERNEARSRWPVWAWTRLAKR